MTDADPTSPVQTMRSDPRTGLKQAITLAGEVLGGVDASTADGPTPCTEYSIRQLSNHLVAILRRVAVVGRGGDAFSVPNFAEDVPDGDWADAWRQAADDVMTMLDDPSIMGRPFRMAFGEVPGAAALTIFATEFTLHTWDLATATGQQPNWNADLIAQSISTMNRVPPEPRGGPIPFGPVVEVDDDAPDIDKLVAWYGRSPASTGA